MNLVQAITTMYPDAIQMENFIVQDDSDGKGPYIAVWRLPYPIPTDEQLKTSWIDYLRKEKQLELKTACETAILSGFTASNGHSYQFDYKDQDNFTQQMLLYVSDPTNTTTVDWNTNEGVVTHTRDEFFAVCQDSSVHKRNNFTKYWGFLNDLALATGEDEINALKWS